MHGAARGRGSFAFIDRPGDDVLVVSLPGRLSPSGLTRYLCGLRPSRSSIILDLSRVPELDDVSLDILSTMQRRLRHRGARLFLWQLRDQPRRLIDEQRFDRVVDIIDDDLTQWLTNRSPAERATRAPGTAEVGAGDASLERSWECTHDAVDDLTGRRGARS